VTIASIGGTPPTACARVVLTDRLEASKVDGSYADHNNKITVAECARDWACDPLGIAAKRGRS